MSRDTDMCECGHPKDAHPLEISGTGDRTPCRATIYRNVPGGTNAWPCPCTKFTHDQERSTEEGELTPIA